MMHGSRVSAWERALLIAIAIAMSALFGCAHQTTFVSEPPGAEVFVDGELKGETPLVVDGNTGAPDLERVEVRDPRTGESARFDLVHDGWKTEAVVVAILAGVGTFLSAGLMIVPFLVGYVSLYALLFSFSFGGVVDPVLAFGGILVAMSLVYGSYVAALLLAASAPTVALVLIGEGSRVGPDEVFVDFTEGEVTTSPPDLVVPLAGARHGQAMRRGDAQERRNAASIVDESAPSSTAEAASESPRTDRPNDGGTSHDSADTAAGAPDEDAGLIETPLDP